MPLLSDMTVGILAEDGVDQVHLTEIRETLEKAGVTVLIISPQADEVKAWLDNGWGNRIKIDNTLSDTEFETSDALIIPGGVLHSDLLRQNLQAIDLVKQFFGSGKLLAALGHGVQLLVNGKTLNGRQITSIPSLKVDVINAGGLWSNEQIVIDNGLLTTAGTDLRLITNRIMEELKEGIHQRVETII